MSTEGSYGIRPRDWLAVIWCRRRAHTRQSHLAMLKTDSLTASQADDLASRGIERIEDDWSGDEHMLWTITHAQPLVKT